MPKRDFDKVVCNTSGWLLLNIGNIRYMKNSHFHCKCFGSRDILKHFESKGSSNFEKFGKISLSISQLTLPDPISNKEKKVNLNFYFHTSLWCLNQVI